MASSQMQAHPAASLYSLLSPDPHGKAVDSPRQPAAAMAALPKISGQWRAAQVSTDDAVGRAGGVDTRFEARAGFHAFAPSIATHSAAFSASAGFASSSNTSASSTVVNGTSVRVNVGHPQVMGEAPGKGGVLSTRSPSSPSSFFTQPESQVCVKFCVGTVLLSRRRGEGGGRMAATVSSGNVWTSTSVNRHEV